MTDNDIIKALECCSYNNYQCDNCPYAYKTCTVYKDAIDLITRQKAEIEKLKQDNKEYHEANLVIAYQRNQRDEEIQELHRQLNGLNFMEQQIKSEAIKEFAERLKGHAEPQYPWLYTVDVDFIDNLVKEMVGDNNAE